MSGGAVLEAAGIVVAIGVALFAGLCIVANAAFKAAGLPGDDVDGEGEDDDVA